MKKLTSFVLVAALAAIPACKKKKEEAPAPGFASGEMAGSGSQMTPPPPDEGSGSGSATETAEETADFISVFAEHAPDKKPDDPVEVKFEKFEVKKVEFTDPNNLEGGSATIEVDLASLKTGSEKRDKHLNTADYIDTSKFTTMTIDVGNVKKAGDNKYTADAKIKLRDIEKTYPVEFEVVEAKDDWVKIKGEHKFARLDFKVGKEKIGEDEAVGHDLTVKLQLTLKKT